jgi:hypothetical protein
MKIEQIHKKIQENSRVALYSSLVLASNKASSGEVGIWWILKGKVISIRELAKNLPEDSFVCVEQEHCKVWPFVQKQYSESIPEILEVSYNQVERGRVWYSPADKKFVITCSKKIKNSPESISAIKNWFGIEGKSVLVKNDPQYDVEEIKI